MGLLLLNKRPSSGIALDIQAKVGVSSSPTVTGTQAITGVGFQPKVVMPFGTLLTADGNGVTLSNSFGAGVSSSNMAGISVDATNGATTSVTSRRHVNNNIVTGLSGNGVVFIESNLSSVDSDGFTLNWSTVAAASRILNHICLGGADLEVSLTQHQMNNDNSNQSFAHGLSGAPTGLMFFLTSPESPPFTGPPLQLGLGIWANGVQNSSFIYSQNSSTTANTSRSLWNNNVFTYNGFAKTIVRSMAVSSVDSTNVNCTYPVTTIASQLIFYMLAIRGARCQTGTFDCNGSLSPLTINTTGITPKLFLPVFVPIGVDSINTVQNSLAMSIGASDGTNNVSCGITDQNGITTTNARRFQSSTSLVEHRIDNGVKATEMTASFSGESVILSPTTMDFSTYGQGCYLVIGS